MGAMKKTALALAAFATSIILAPVASADSSSACDQGTGVVTCHTKGSTSIRAVPTTRAPLSGQQMGGLGLVPRALVLGWGGY